MASEMLNTLVEMGFAKEKAERGLSMTGNQSVEQAMEWILSHSDELEAGPSASTNGENAKPEDAKSLKCDDCGKLFATQEMVEFHAAKSGHTNFSESTEEKKPLTEEEKQEQLRKIEEKLKEKRREREEKEKQEQLEREKARIRSGKEITEAKKRLEELEMKKIIDDRKREKEEEKQARLRVKRLIEADKQARKAAAAAASGNPIEETKKSESPKCQVDEKPRSAPKEYTETKIQIRLTNGETLTQTFSPKELLAAVRVFVEMKRTDGDIPFKLMTSFPRKVFTEDEEREMRLCDLGLVPSAVIILTKAV